jgi:hypothetical protein
MKLSKKQQAELDVIKYFIPERITFSPITDKDIQDFFGWSDRGIKYTLKPNTMDGLAALHYGKQYRDLHITQWSEGIEDGIISKYEILSDLPSNIRPQIEKALQIAMLGKPMFEAVNGEMVFVGYEKQDAVDFRHKFGRSILSKSS